MTGLIIPMYIAAMLLSAVIARKRPYSGFVEGAGRGLKGAAGVLPYMLAMMLAVGMFRASGLADAVSGLADGLLGAVGIPEGMGMFMLLRPFSGSAALAELDAVFVRYGVDSAQGRLASVLMGSTETIFYTVPVYLSAAKIKSSARAVTISIIAMLAGTTASALLVNLFFK